MTGRKTLGQRIARNWELYLFILPVRRADGVSGIRAWFIRDNVVQATTLQPGYRDAVTWLHSIYAEGLLDQEAFTYEIQAYRAKNQDGVIGVSPTWGGWNIVPEGSAAQAKEWWTPIPPLAGPDGSRDAEFKALSGIGNGLVITNASEMPEALVRYVDLNYIPENGVQWSLGPLGHNLFQDDQGRIGYVPTPAEYSGYGQFRISASFTDFESRNTLATSGSRMTMFAPSLYCSAYLPRTPSEKSYSSRNSSIRAVSGSFFIPSPFVGCRQPSVDQTNRVATHRVCDGHKPVTLGHTEQDESILIKRVIRVRGVVCRRCSRAGCGSRRCT